MRELQYDEDYYNSHCGIPYTRAEPHWHQFFGMVARELDQRVRPATVFDAGCAIGFLVEALRARGIEAFGRDLSPYAISQVPAGLRAFCSQGSVSEPIREHFDLITCIEVVEHMPEDEARQAIHNFAASTPRVFFSSSPTDFNESTHVNVQTPLYWMRLFAEAGFAPVVTFDGSFLCPWAILFEKRSTPPVDAELHAQAELIKLRLQMSDRRAAAEVELRNDLNALKSQFAEMAGRSAKIDELSNIPAALGALGSATSILRAETSQLQNSLGQVLEKIGALEARAHRLSETGDLQNRPDIAEVLDSKMSPLRAEMHTLQHSLGEVQCRLNDLNTKPRILSLISGSRTRRKRKRVPNDSGMAVVLNSGLFDSAWYTAEYPDVAKYQEGALAHYFDYGAAEGRNPNPCFSTSWYVKTYPEVGLSGMNPLQHYVVAGSMSGLMPAEDFDPVWYSRNYPDVPSAGPDPLLHYLRHGQSEGRRRNPFDRSRDLDDAAIKILKEPDKLKELALFVTHAPAGRIRPHVPIYIKALRNSGFSVIAIVVADNIATVQADDLVTQVDGLILRENGGYDFAAWAHAIRHVDLSDAEVLALVNDSLVGPLWADGLTDVLDKVRKSPADLVGLTESHEFKRHLQSFFLVAKGHAIAAVTKFLETVRMLDSKQDVIMSYELQLTEAVEAQGFSGAAIFPNAGKVNRTIDDWKGLNDDGFPFVKMSVLQGMDSSDLNEFLIEYGSDVALSEQSIKLIGKAEIGQPKELPKDGLSVIPQGATPNGKSVEEQDIEINGNARQVQIEKELVRAVTNPWSQVRRNLKYRIYRRLSRLSPPLPKATAAHFARRSQKYDPKRFLTTPTNGQFVSEQDSTGRTVCEYQGKRPIDPRKPNVLVVSHLANRSGAPILALNIAEILAERYNVTSLCLVGGELLDEFVEVSVRAIDVGLCSAEASDYAEILNHLSRETSYSFAVVNSIQSHAILFGLHQLGVPSVALLHEFASYVGKRSAFSEAIRWSSEVVFSSRLTMESAAELDHSALELMHKVTVLPQGQCRVPVSKRSSSSVELERRALREQLNPSSERGSQFLVLGAGTVEVRKGVDLFLEAATRVLNLPGGENVRFVWIGSGYDPDHDFGYSVYLRDQLRRAQLEERVVFLPATGDLDLVYELSDVLLLTSRLDPLPNVAIDAMCFGMPVLCFENASGVADLLISANLGEACVARYLDTFELAEKVLRLATRPEYYGEISDRTRELGQDRFELRSYVDKIERLGLAAGVRCSAHELDVKEIVAAGTFRPDFFWFNGSTDKSPEEGVKAYLEQLDWIGGARKPEPGFNPFIYETLAQDRFDRTRDAYAEFLKKGRPKGPWLLPVLEGAPAAEGDQREARIRAALHVHGYHVDELPEVVSRLGANSTKPDLFVSISDADSEGKVREILADYAGNLVDLRVVPNLGRDVGPFLTEFGAQLCGNYEVIGHVHLKKSPHVTDPKYVAAWTQFLYENVLGGEVGGCMIDRIMERFEREPDVGLIYPDDPHIIGWSRNHAIARSVAKKFMIEELPLAINFPVGTMFWIRAEALKRFVELGLDWKDYPREPIPIDGTMLHALERLFGVIPTIEGWQTVVTNVRGLTR